MRGYIAIILFLAVVTVVGNFFGYWKVPGLEGMTTFQEKRTVRAESAPGAQLTAEQIAEQNARNVRRRDEALRNGGGVN